jgi:hypothetical protein
LVSAGFDPWPELKRIGGGQDKGALRELEHHDFIRESGELTGAV